jgi:hypothetical protein
MSRGNVNAALLLISMIAALGLIVAAIYWMIQ